MPQGTLERSAPPFFKQGPSAVSRLVFYSALALFLMVADQRFQVTGPLRQVVSTVLYPVQWLMLQPVEWAGRSMAYVRT
ncbi:MAG: rod shape-determining protein MreC, partial [Burkholderiaceae bacterium]|nr:rod shape-determining protein MreC [Burkholderiaceae bacterium]